MSKKHLNEYEYEIYFKSGLVSKGVLTASDLDEVKSILLNNNFAHLNNDTTGVYFNPNEFNTVQVKLKEENK